MLIEAKNGHAYDRRLDIIQNEEQFRDSLLGKLSNLNPQYELDIEVPIPYKHMYVKEGSDIVLEVWRFKQDIVFFKPLIDKTVSDRGANIQANGQPLIRFKLEKDNAQNTSGCLS